MAENQTIAEFFSRFDKYNQTPYGTVIIHPGLPYSLVEMEKEVVEQLKKELQHKLRMVTSGIEEADAITKFAVMMLQNSY